MQSTTFWATGLSALALSVPLTAQTVSLSGAMRSATPIGVFAQEGSNLQYKALPANQVIRPGSSGSISAQVGNTHSATLFGWRERNGVVSADISEQGGVSVAPSNAAAAAGTSGSAPNTRPQPGPHAFLLRVKGRPGTEALAEFWATGGTNGSTSDRVPGGYLIDFFNDRNPEFKAGIIGFARNSLVLRFPASGVIDIRLQSEVNLRRTQAGSLLYKSGLSVRVTPAPLCVGAPYGEGCGPELSASFSSQPNSRDIVSVEASKARPGTPGLLGIGKRQLRVNIPGIMCPILVDPVIVAGFRFNNQGGAGWKAALPPNYRIELRMQVVALGLAASAQASNGLHLFCSK